MSPAKNIEAPNHRWSRVAVFAASAMAVVGSFASCATTRTGPMSEDDSRTSVPDASSTDDVVVADADAGAPVDCEDDDPDCTTEVVSCDEVAWCLHPTPLDVLHTFTAIWGSGPNDVWAVGSGGSILHYDGKTWVKTPSGVVNTLYAIWGSGPNDIWVVSDTTTVLHGSGFKGGTATWTRSETGFSPWNSAPIRAVWGTSPEDVRIGGRAFDLDEPDWDNGIYAGHQLLKTTAREDGVVWKQVPGTPTVLSMWGSSASDVWMAADNGTYASHERGLLLHGTPRGEGEGDDPLVWKSVDSQSALTLNAVWGSGPNDIWAVGVLGSIRHWTPGKVRFDKVASPTTVTLNAVWGSGPNDIWVVGDSGTVLHYDGTSFEPSTVQLPLGRRPNLYGVWGSSANDVWIVGDGVALHYTGPKPPKGGTK